MSIKQRVFNKESWSAYLGSLRYALHCCVRPFDGFWDLTHEKRGSVGAANTIVILVLLTNLSCYLLSKHTFKFFWQIIHTILGGCIMSVNISMLYIPLKFFHSYSC